MPNDLEFYHNHELSTYVSGRSNRLADTTTGVRWEIWEDVYLNVQLDWDWESDPADGSESEDLTYAFGVGFALD